MLMIVSFHRRGRTLVTTRADRKRGAMGERSFATGSTNHLHACPRAAGSACSPAADGTEDQCSRSRSASKVTGAPDACCFSSRLRLPCRGVHHVEHLEVRPFPS